MAVGDINQPEAIPDGSSLPLVLDHYMRYPGSYEIPLRTMYSLNCKPTKRAQATQKSGKPLPKSAFSKDPSSSYSSLPHSDAAAEFRAQLISHIARLPTQPCSLPPSLISSFLRRCFAANLEEVDFPQALTGLDYLRDLENRRRKEVLSALTRLGVDYDTSVDSELGKKHPGVLSWVQSIQYHERRIESLYSQAYLGLRRWVSTIIGSLRRSLLRFSFPLTDHC